MKMYYCKNCKEEFETSVDYLCIKCNSILEYGDKKYCPHCKCIRNTSCTACGCGSCLVCSYQFICNPVDVNSILQSSIPIQFLPLTLPPTPTLKIKKLHENAIVPVRNFNSDAGLDLFSLERVTLDRNRVVKIRTGIAIELPPNHVGLIWDRSSMGSNGFKVYGGVIDEAYRGEIVVMLGWSGLQESETVEAGTKIAQLLIQKIEKPVIEVVSDLSHGERGEKGFGSSGK